MEIGWGTKVSHEGARIRLTSILPSTRNITQRLQNQELGSKVANLESQLRHLQTLVYGIEIIGLSLQFFSTLRFATKPIRRSFYYVIGQHYQPRWDIFILVLKFCNCRFWLFLFVRIYSVISFTIRKFRKEYSSISIEELVIFVQNLWSRDNFVLFCSNSDFRNCHLVVLIKVITISILKEQCGANLFCTRNVVGLTYHVQFLWKVENPLCFHRLGFTWNLWSN